jgi:hypothetical protein
MDDREIIRLYSELLNSVKSAYPNETRHQTALRYIKQREDCKPTPRKENGETKCKVK